MRPLSVVDVGDPRSLLGPLTKALFEGGPAVLPRPGGARISHTAPLEVDDQIALVIETSGTTGAPKRVGLSAEAVLAGAEMTSRELGGGGSWLLALPAHYIAGVQVCVRAHLAGGEPLFLHPEPFSSIAVASRADDVAKARAAGPVFTSLVPAQLQRLLDDSRDMPILLQVLQGFDAVLVGGQAVPSTLLEQAHEAGVSVRRTYGSSETAGGCVWDGRPLSGVTLREHEGRIAIAGAMLAEGYIDNPVKTAEHFIEESGTRWYLTDDSGSLDSTGTLAIAGRVDDTIISGGIKVSLAQIERVVHDTTTATDAVVVASPDDTWGQVPVLVSTTAVDREAVRAELAKQLGVHARIDRVTVVDAMPMLASGKPDRRALTALVAGVRHG